MIKWHIKYFSNDWKTPRRLIGKGDNLEAAGHERPVEGILLQNALENSYDAATLVYSNKTFYTSQVK